MASKGMKHTTKPTPVCRRWRGEGGKGGGGDISRLPSNTENPLVNDYWFSLWRKMGHGRKEFISADGDHGQDAFKEEKKRILAFPAVEGPLCSTCPSVRAPRDVLRRGSLESPPGHNLGRCRLSMTNKTQASRLSHDSETHSTEQAKSTQRPSN